jgi:hypothetical protein|uniref:Uncharacterized protein n=1 Tax=viral metagenome TaxID=1070528 RepID=A0A6C0I874_9ZZZZ
MNPKHIIHALKISYHKSVKIPLGRWNIHNDRQTKLKIKYANEDNCGTSGNYSNYSEKIKESKESEELYMYMLGSESLPDSLHTKR